MQRSRLVVALGLSLCLAPLAFAGGIAFHIRVPAQPLVPDAKGLVKVELTLERGRNDCGGTGFLACDPQRPGPLVHLERQQPDGSWAAVTEPWGKPPEQHGRPRDTKVPYRFDHRDRLGFQRRTKLAPGTYRARAVLRIPDMDWDFERRSPNFVVAAAGKPSSP